MEAYIWAVGLSPSSGTVTLTGKRETATGSVLGLDGAVGGEGAGDGDDWEGFYLSLELGVIDDVEEE